MLVYPFRCKPIYKEKVWGGRWFAENFNRSLPDTMLIGESWELSCRPDGMSEVMDGVLAGKTFEEIIKLYPDELLGKSIARRGFHTFPLLIKFLDANDRLSVQVHPDDQYLTKRGLKELGKTEMWYILGAKPGGKIVIGVKEDVTTETFIQGIKDNTLQNHLKEIPVKPGDAFHIPAGTVHAILEGVQIAEIQQNSDITYRIYDWNRLGLDGHPRPLHIKEALEVTDLTCTDTLPLQGVTIDGKNWRKRLLVVCQHFSVEEIEIKDLYGETNPRYFEVWMVVDGCGTLEVQNKRYYLSLGETWFIPAGLGRYQLSGEIKILRIYLPDLFSEIVYPLLEMGYTKSDLLKIGGLGDVIKAMNLEDTDLPGRVKLFD